MVAFHELSETQRRLVDTYIALHVAHLVASSNEVPVSICDESFRALARERYSGLIGELEAIAATIAAEARQLGVSPDHPEQYLEKVMQMVQKILRVSQAFDQRAAL